jgi:hypothetical protein
MFRHDHHAEDITARIDHLMVAVFVPGDSERIAGLAEHLASDFVYVGPEGVYDGAAGLSEAFVAYRRPGMATTLRRTSPVEVHHGYFRFTWQRLEDGVSAMEGWAFGSFDERGDIRRIVVFEGLAPSRGRGRGAR